MTVVMETTLDGAVRRHVGEADDNAFINLVITEILAGEDPAAVLTPLLRGYLIGRRRSITRALEHSVLREDEETGPRERGAMAVVLSNPAMVGRLRPLLSEYIHIPGVGKVSWGTATVEQLERRAAMYRDQRQRLGHAISDLETAIQVIRSHPGAQCLNDVLSEPIPQT